MFYDVGAMYASLSGTASLHGYYACMVYWNKGALRRNCRLKKNVRPLFLVIGFFCVVEILLNASGFEFSGIFGLGGQDILVHPPNPIMLVLSFIMLVAGSLMVILLLVLVLIFLLLLGIGLFRPGFRSEWSRLRSKRLSSIWAPAFQDCSHVGNAGVGVVSLRGAPLALPTLATAQFKSFFDCGRALRCLLPLAAGRFIHLFVLYGYQGADADTEQLVETEQLLLDMRRRFKAVMDVLGAMIRHGVSLSRSVELTAHWDRVLALGPVYPVTLDDLSLDRALGIGAFFHAASDVHRRLSDFIHQVVVHRRDESIRGWRSWIREDPMVHPYRWLRPDLVPPAPFLQCEPCLTPGGSGVLSDPARIDEEFRKAWLPYFCRSGQREASFDEFDREVEGWLPLLPEVSLPRLTGRMLADVVQRKSATGVEGVEGFASLLIR